MNCYYYKVKYAVNTDNKFVFMYCKIICGLIGRLYMKGGGVLSALYNYEEVGRRNVVLRYTGYRGG